MIDKRYLPLLILLAILIFLASCATVGPVEVTPDDTPITVGSAIILGLFVIWFREWVVYRFNLKLHRKSAKDE